MVLFSVWLMLGFGSAGLPLGLPPADPDALLAHVAPEECIFYASWAGMAKPDPESSNQTEQLLAEPEVQYMVTEGVKRIEAAIRQATAEQGPEASAMAEDAIGWAKMLFTHSAAVFVSYAQMTPAGPDVRGAAVVNVGPGAPAFRESLEQYQSRFFGDAAQPLKIGDDEWYRLKLAPKAPEITWGTKGKYFIVGVGEGSIEGILERAFTPPPKWLSRIRERLPIQRESTISYVNASAILDTVAPLGGPQAVRAIDALGVGGLTSLASVTGLDGDGFANKTLLGIEGQPSGILGLAEGEPLTADELAAIPADATVGIALRLDADRVLETIANVVGTIQPEARGEMEEGLAAMTQQTGIDLRNDVLRPLGDVWCVYNSPGEGGLVLTGLTAVVQVEDAQKMRQTQQKLQLLIEAMMNMRADRRYGPKIEQLEFAGHRIYVLDVGEDEFPLAPSWCLTDKQVVLALFPQNIKAYLSRDHNFRSLAEVPEVADMLASESPPLMLSYADTEAMFEMFYPLAQMGLQLAMTQFQRQGIDIDLSIMPSAAAIRPHLRPTVVAIRRTKDGIEAVSQQTMPGGNMGATAPIAVALLLPAVQSAREAARRAQSMNNLKQIGLALHFYHDTYKHFPPAYTVDEEGKPLLSWRVHILPFIEAGPLYEQFHLDEPWDSEHNKSLIDQMPSVLRSPNWPGAPGRTNYLGIGGEDGIFRGKDPVSFADIRDGTSNTLVTVEANNQSTVIWTKPEDLIPDPEDPFKGLTGLRPGGFNAGFADGSVRFIGEWIDPEVLKALFTRAKGEPIDRSQLDPPRPRGGPFGSTAWPDVPQVETATVKEADEEELERLLIEELERN